MKVSYEAEVSIVYRGAIELTPEQAEEYAELTIDHARYDWLSDLVGRHVLADPDDDRHVVDIVDREWEVPS